MQTRTNIMITSLVALAGSASAQLTVFTDQAAWEAELASRGLTSIVETFDGVESGDLNPGDAPFNVGDIWITVEGQVGDAEDAFIANGRWHGEIFPGVRHDAYVHRFDAPIAAFGQNYLGAASGLGIRLETTEGTLDIFDDAGLSGFEDGFLGFISEEPVWEVRIIGSDADGGGSAGEIYDAEDALYAFAGSDASVFSASGFDADSIVASLEAFRADLGDLNRPDPGSRGAGRREINWDGAPDALSAPNAFPGDLFNGPNFPLARGAEFTTPGTGFQLSATEASGVGTAFANIDPAFEFFFEAFSPERLFTPLGSTTTDVHFFVPGTDLPATSRGFGAVFSDVSDPDASSIECFDLEGNSLGVFPVPAAPVTEHFETFSFLGISFEEPVIASVRITSGASPIDNWSDADLVVMDDFIFGEPIAPCPADLNGDHLVDFYDVLTFLAAFDAREPLADFALPFGEFDIFDVQVYLNIFDTGCN